MANYNSAYTGAQIDAAVGAVASKANDSDVVHNTGNETVAGVKTFSSFPVTPSSAPTTNYQVANKKYVDDKVKTDVPVDAKFTDTVTTINGKTGAILKSDIVALGIPAQDTVYTHPATHPASMIEESSSRRFVSDTEKAAWSAKQDALGYTPVPNTRKVNNKALSSDITLDAADIGAVPTTRKVNNKALSQDITLSASDVGAIPASQKGTANGVAELDANGKVPSSQLPSYVDDVLEYDKLSSFPSTGETGKIYIARDTNLCYRWSGSGYVEISPSLALGETATTAYRGDRGKIAYDHSQATGNPHGTTPADIGAVPTTRKINGKSLTADVSLSATDVGAAAASHTHTKSQISDFPASMMPTAHASTHKTGGSDALTPADIGAAASGHTHSDYMPKSGGTFTGIATAQSNTSYTTPQIRNIVLSTSDPSGGNNGDVWIKYT